MGRSNVAVGSSQSPRCHSSDSSRKRTQASVQKKSRPSSVYDSGLQTRLGRYLTILGVNPMISRFRKYWVVKFGTNQHQHSILTAEVAAFQYFPRWLFEPTYLESQAEARERPAGHVDVTIVFDFFKPHGRLKKTGLLFSSKQPEFVRLELEEENYARY